MSPTLMLTVVVFLVGWFVGRWLANTLIDRLKARKSSR